MHGTEKRSWPLCDHLLEQIELADEVPSQASLGAASGHFGGEDRRHRQ
jgi:hypothetical protein